MAEVSTQSQPQAQSQQPADAHRKRGRNRAPRRGGKGKTGPANASATNTTNGIKRDAPPHTATAPAAQTDADADADADADQDLCWICAEPVKYYAVSECNHRTCHVCSLRLRALYKKMDCTFCKEPQPTVIFTASPDDPFSSYTPERTAVRDQKLAILFETREMMEDALVLLRFNCPESSCDYIASGWNDLKLHARGVHGRLMCDLCIRHKKVFSHEHALYTSAQLATHLPSILHRQQKSAPRDQVEGGVHPLCEFCHECFFSDDELYAHMRHDHEECFICKRNEVRDQYFKNYEALERHFDHAHHPCANPTCQARKFVVFGSAIDLQAHMVEEHGAEMSSRDKKDARRVEAVFEFRDSPAGPGRRRGGGAGSGGREREPPQPPPAAQPAARQLVASESRRSRFGAHLTTEADASETSPGPSRHQTPSPPPASLDPVAAERYTALFARLRVLAPNPTSATASVKLALRDYATAHSGARDLLSTLWSVLDRDLDATASLVNLAVDTLPTPSAADKRAALLQAWHGFRIERRSEFPDLAGAAPSAVGTDYAGIAHGRVVPPPPQRQAQRAVWDRVARAAERGASFPALGRRGARPAPAPVPSPQPRAPAPPPPALAPPAPAPGFRAPVRSTAWSASSAGNAPPAPNEAAPVSAPAPAPTLTRAAFPTLPGSAAPRARPVVSARNKSLQTILGSAPPATSAWAAGSEAAGANGLALVLRLKKSKQKQKQMLFSLGSSRSAGA
ncbi:hypothetical protein BC834DRAFT_1027710 [Gloeopeniophorella convolvens]|nr:hypothetical protein BC834DRAFT_1027710 [Gloeopeniophorella convolvens]